MLDSEEEWKKMTLWPPFKYPDSAGNTSQYWNQVGIGTSFKHVFLLAKETNSPTLKVIKS